MTFSARFVVAWALGAWCLAAACLPAARCAGDDECSGGNVCVNGACQLGNKATGSASGQAASSASSPASTTGGPSSAAVGSGSTSSGAPSTSSSSSSSSTSTQALSTTSAASTNAASSSSSSNGAAGASSSSSTSSSSTSGSPSSGGSCTRDDQCGVVGGCITQVQCNNGRCEVFILPPNTACEDGDPCTHQERCSSTGTCTGTPGTCLAPAYDDPCTTDSSCGAAGQYACVNGRCRIQLGGTCVADSNCGSAHCVNGRCCDEACDGLCMQCGQDGRCVGTADDPACPTLTCSGYSSACSTFADVTTNRCAQKGACRSLDLATCASLATVTTQPDGTPCRAATGPCDIEEGCSMGRCPVDAVLPANSVCNPAEPTRACDVDDLCDGMNKGCPRRVANAGTTCRTHGTCNAPEACNGTDPDCPADVPPVYTTGFSCDGGNIGTSLNEPPASSGDWATFKDRCNTHCDSQPGVQCCMAVDFPGIYAPPYVNVPAFWGCFASVGHPVVADGGAIYEGYACGY